MKQELVDRYPGDALAVTIVWSPMMPGDNEDTAREAAAMFEGKGVVNFYDPKRHVGDSFRHRVFPDAYDKAFASLPQGHWLREELPQMKSRYETSPEWDIYMFFDPGLKWRKSPPHPTRFVRHLGRIIETDEGRVSLMWIDDYSNPPVEGDLPSEIAKLGHDLMEKKSR